MNSRIVGLVVLLCGCGAAPPVPAEAERASIYERAGLRDPFVPAGETEVIGVVISGVERWAVLRNPALQEEVVSMGTRLPMGRVRNIDRRGIVVDRSDGTQTRLMLAGREQ